jgi:hypothetical protein
MRATEYTVHIVRIRRIICEVIHVMQCVMEHLALARAWFLRILPLYLATRVSPQDRGWLTRELALFLRASGLLLPNYPSSRLSLDGAQRAI